MINDGEALQALRHIGAIVSIRAQVEASPDCRLRSYGGVDAGMQSDYGKHVLCERNYTRPCVALSYGVEADYSFELALAQRARCRVIALDPTVVHPSKLAPNVWFLSFAAPATHNHYNVCSRESRGALRTDRASRNRGYFWNCTVLHHDGKPDPNKDWVEVGPAALSKLVIPKPHAVAVLCARTTNTRPRPDSLHGRALTRDPAVVAARWTAKDANTRCTATCSNTTRRSSIASTSLLSRYTSRGRGHRRATTFSSMAGCSRYCCARALRFSTNPLGGAAAAAVAAATSLVSRRLPWPAATMREVGGGMEGRARATARICSLRAPRRGCDHAVGESGLADEKKPCRFCGVNSEPTNDGTVHHWHQ